MRQKMSDKNSKIFKYIEAGDLENLISHLDSHPEDLEATEKEWSCTPLVWAAFKNKPKCLKHLIKAGANLDHQDSDQDTALTTAARDGHYECVDILVKAGADKTLRREDGKTAADVADNDQIRRLIQMSNNGIFVKENDHSVSITDYYEHTGLSVKRVFNFMAGHVITKSHDHNGSALCIKDFDDDRNNKELSKAARFLESKNGNIHGFKPKQRIIQ